MPGLPTLDSTPAASSSAPPRPDPPALRTASRSSATTGLSNLTTRSSSASRVYTPEATYAPLISPVWPGAFSEAARPSELSGGADAYRAWPRDARERALRSKGKRRSADAGDEAAQLQKENQIRAVVSGRVAGKGKDKAVAFVVGIPSSGDDGDGEYEEEGENAAADLHHGGEGIFGRVLEGDALVAREPDVAEIIRAQIRQPVRIVDPQDLDSLLPFGIADYTFVRQPTTSTVSAVSPSPALDALPASAPDSSRTEPSDRVTLGKGKFSEVLLVRKGETEYALKHTPLHPHHQLISTRLLREPTILAQLLPHRNLVKVFETIRTPGHFYLVEECLQSSVTLEELVSSSPDGVLPLDQAWSVLEQLASVVKNLHEPLRVCHRDIKPENVLIRIIPPPPSAPASTPPSLHLKLLDFGLATHFSSSEPKLTTCCGSPAYHSPELWRGLRDKFGAVRYWGPEVDAWCVGVTVLRCITPSKYPIGIGHASLQSLADKVVDALLAVPDASMRKVLAGFLHLDGTNRMRAFDRFCASLQDRAARRAADEARQVKTATPREKKEFKTTSFIPAPLAHRLELFLDEVSFARNEGPKLEATVIDDSLESLGEQATSSAAAAPRVSRSTSSARTATIDEPQVAFTTVVATGLARAASGSRTAASNATPSSSPPCTNSPAFTASNPSTDSLTSSSSSAPPTPSLYPLPSRHPSYPPPIELVLLNPTDEPIRRAVSYVKYALRCKGVLYHVREDSPTSHLSSSSSFSTAATPTSIGFATPDSAPPSLPPTPYAQPFTLLTPLGGFPFPTDSPLDESFVCYLQCVVALPPWSLPSASPPSSATSRLRATLQQQDERRQQTRPHMPLRAHTHAGYGFERDRSASTPPQRLSDLGRAGAGGGGRKAAQPTGPEKVEALTFFLSIRKPGAADGDANRRRSRRSRGAKAAGDEKRDERDAVYASRVVLTLSDDRALPLVRDALALVDGAGVQGSDGDREADLRGRDRRAGQVTSPRPGQGDNSGSRDARARRHQVAAQVKRREEGEEGIATGLGMQMGAPASEEKGGGGLWDFMGRLVGGGRSASMTRDAPAEEVSTPQERRTRARSSLGM